MSLSLAAAIVATAGLAAVAAGCGGSPGSHVSQRGSTATQTSSLSSASSRSGSTRDQALAYAGCLRSHGVTNWPDPNTNGTFDKSKLTLQQLGVSSRRLQAAQAACRHLLPNGGAVPNPAQVQQVRAESLSYAHCVRSHGVPNFPDPDSTGRIPDPATAGIDQGSPKFQAANHACGRYRPPYMPSNAAYNSWARTHGS